MARRSTRIRFDERQIQQLAADQITLSGKTEVAEGGEFVLHGAKIIASGATSGDTFVYDPSLNAFVPSEAGAADGKLKQAEDGAYGSGKNVVNLIVDDSYETAFDKIASLLDKIAPAPPQDLASKTFNLNSTFNAKEQGSGVQRSKITDNTRPTIQVSGADGGRFYDGANGILSALVKDHQGTTLDSASATLDAGDNSGGYGLGNMLNILEDAEFNSIYQALRAEMRAPSALSAGNDPYTYELEHSVSGKVDESFYVDSLSTPTISGNSVSIATQNLRYISGVPSLSPGDTLHCDFVVSNAISFFYHPTRVARVESSFIQSPVNAGTGVYNLGDDVTIADLAVAIRNNVFTEGLSLTYRGYNARGTAGSDVASVNQSSNIRVDTRSDESKRVSSGSGQFPPVGTVSTSNSQAAGDAYLSDELLSANEELQLENNIFQYPDKDYSGFLPAGPDYSGLTGMRYLTVDLGNVSNASNVAFELRNASGMSFNAINKSIEGGITLHVKVEGASGSGWLDANQAYASGIPNADGDAALNVGAGGTTTGSNVGRVVTFGSQSRTGRVLVRIGLPQGSNATLADIVMV